MTYHPPHIMRLEEELPGAPEAELTVAPKTPNDVGSILHHASEKGLNVQVWGGGSRSGFGSPPPPDIVMSMRRLDEVEVWEPDDLTMVVGAGAQVAKIEGMLAEKHQTAVLPEVPGSSTVGGVIASGASSLRRGRLYDTRERILETVVVTGDGRIVKSGGRVVKNVTGYDMPRLNFGAFGALGVIVSVCLKLWPTPPANATVSISSLEHASALSRPLAVLEENHATRVYVWGTQAEVEGKVQRLGGSAVEYHDWPANPDGPIQWSLRVPPALVRDGISRLPDSWRYLALHGVGEIRASSESVENAAHVREWAESVGGHLVVVKSPPGSLGDFDPWGNPPRGLDLQRKLIAQFDPARIINPGRLPGGL